MEDFDFLGDGTGSQVAPKSKFERDLEKFGDLSTLKDAKKAEEERLRQAGKSYDVSEKYDPGAGPLEKPDSLKSKGNIDRDALIGMSVPVVNEDEAEEYAAKYAAGLAGEAAPGGSSAATAVKTPLPDVTYKAAAVEDEKEDDIVVVKNDDDDVSASEPASSAPRVISPRQDNGLPALADLSDVWVEEAAKAMGYKDVVLSDREKQQIRMKEDTKLAKHLEQSLREKTRVSASQFTEEGLRTANAGRIMVYVAAAIGILLGGYTFFFLKDNEIISYAGAILAVLGALTFIKLRLLGRLYKFGLLLAVGAYAFPGLMTGISSATLTPVNQIIYIAGIVICVLVLGMLMFAPPVAKYYRTNIREEELQI
jgi:hypothetical protein